MFVVFLAEIYETAYLPWWARRIYLEYKNADRPQNCCWVSDSTFGLDVYIYIIYSQVIYKYITIYIYMYTCISKLCIINYDLINSTMFFIIVFYLSNTSCTSTVFSFYIHICVNYIFCTAHDYGQLSLFVISTAFSFYMCDHVSIAYLNTRVDVD